MFRNIRVTVRNRLIRLCNRLLGPNVTHRAGWARTLLAAWQSLDHAWNPAWIRQRQFERSNPDAPWFAAPSISFLETLLEPTFVGFEWGSGRSTIWFAKRVSKITSVEAREAWHRAVCESIRSEHLEEKVTLLLSPVSSNWAEDPEEIERYISTIERMPDGSLDFLVVDGHFRILCLQRGLRKIRPGGLLILDNSDLPEFTDCQKAWNACDVRRFSNGIWETTIVRAPESGEFPLTARPTPRRLLRLRSNPTYVGVIVSGYAAMACSIGVQLLLIPLYLKGLGREQFGILMTLLAVMNYLAIGSGWVSGGTLRILGECSALQDDVGFGKAYALARVLYVGYAVLAAVLLVVGVAGFDQLFFHNVSAGMHQELRGAILIAGVYLVILYDLSLERIALNARHQQTAGNAFQIVNSFAIVWFVLPYMWHGGNLRGVLLRLLAAVAIARLASWVYWKRLRIEGRWSGFNPETYALLKRLVGPMGMGFLLYGVLMLTLQADTLILAWLGGAGVVAQYVLVCRAPDALVQLFWKVPEMMVPYLIQMDARGERQALQRIYRTGMRWMTLLPLSAGILYALFGPALVRLWVGEAHAPTNRLAFVLAGGSIFWLGSARLPACFACAMIRLRELNIVAGVEAVGKLTLSVVLFPRFGFMASLAALNILHLIGVAWRYRRLGQIYSDSTQPRQPLPD